MRRLKFGGDCCALGLLLGALLLLGSAECLAQAETETEVTLTQSAPGLDTGDNAWMMTSSALVLMMTGPGLALFYCGLVRKKNVLGVMMQCAFLMGLMAVVWVLWGYSLAFGGDNPLIGNADYMLLNNVQIEWTDAGQVVPMEGTIPRLTHMLFQGMFFIITPALICGAFAERMKFSTMIVFMVLWGTFVYCPLCHWVWDGGILAYGSDSSAKLGGGILDFAGGAVVHISSGVSALVCAILIGKRLGHGHDNMPPHNLTYTAMGAMMLWVGWFGFNAGSALASNSLAASAFATTHIGAAAGAITWACIEWVKRGKPTILGTCSGMVAGLGCVTPATGFVQPMHGAIMGVIAGAACYWACTWLKNRLDYDDSLDVFGVHGISGTLGTFMVGIFATRAVTDLAVSGGQPLGVLEGGSMIIGQTIGVIVTWGVSLVMTFILLKVLDATMGLRVTQQEEIQGLDLSQHGEEGYILL